MPNIVTVQESLQVFTKPFQSLVISSITDQGEPYASYAPFVKVDDDYYFLISKIAKHYDNMLNHPQIAIFFLEDEAATQNIFFRKRLSYHVKTMFTQDPDVKAAFITKFGDFVKQLFAMDFFMVKCEINHGLFVIGPGQAYEVDAQQQIIKQMTGKAGKGHSQP